MSDPPASPTPERRRRRRSAWLVAGLVVVNLSVAAFVSPPGVSPGDEAGDEAEDGADSPDAAPDDTEPGETTASGSYLMDPQLFDTPDGSWAVGSSTDGVTMPLLEVADDGTAHEVGGALASQPAWASQGFVGPSVVEDDGTWWLFFAAQANDTGRYCLGAASTTDVSQGFEPAEAPLRCTDERDLVDPSVYRSGDGLVLTWAQRTAGTASGAATTDTTASAEADAADAADSWRIEAAPLDLGDTSLGEVSVLLTGEAGGWEAGIVDAPALVEVDGTLVLLYSGNMWGSESYAAGYAVCDSPAARCERRSVDAPLEIPIDEAAGELSPAASLQPVVGADGDGIQVAGFALAAGADGQGTPVPLRAALSWTDGALEVGPATTIDLDGG